MILFVMMINTGEFSYIRSRKKFDRATVFTAKADLDLMAFKMRLFVLLLLVLCFSPVFASSLADIVEVNKKSIVAVGTYMPKRSPKGVFLGTGFVIGDGRLIVTNAHVLPKNIELKSIETVAVFFRQKQKIKMSQVKVVAVDKEHDIAVLKLASAELPAMKLSDSVVREGQFIAFTGYPIGMVLGLHPVTHRGIVSAISPVVLPMLRARQLNAKLLKRLRNPYDVYQLDATAYPGNSGSPVYEEKTGRVIGIVNKVFIKESKETVLSKPSGITYAIPIRYLNDLLRKTKLI